MLFDPEAPLTSAEVAAALKVNRQTVARWVQQGHVNIVRQLPGRGGYLIAPEEVSRLRGELARGIRFGKPRSSADAV